MNFDYTIFLEPSIVLLTGILACLVSINSEKKNSVRDRLEKAYHPLFMAAEPRLYVKIDKTFINEFIQSYYHINNDYSLYFYPSLRFHIENLINNHDKMSETILNNNWFQICSYIERDYDRLCKQAHMPIRSTAYRLNKKQYQTKFQMCWYIFKLFIVPILAFFAMASFYIILISSLDALAK